MFLKDAQHVYVYITLCFSVAADCGFESVVFRPSAPPHSCPNSCSSNKESPRRRRRWFDLCVVSAAFFLKMITTSELQVSQNIRQTEKNVHVQRGRLCSLRCRRGFVVGFRRITGERNTKKEALLCQLSSFGQWFSFAGAHRLGDASGLFLSQ